MKKLVLVLASESEDCIYKESEKTPTIRKGGPAFFIRKAFDDLGIEYRLAKSSPAKVEIKITKNKEIGRILKPDEIEIPRKIVEPYVLVSTIGPNALNLDFLAEYNGSVFLDIQGFVRQEEGTKFGGKKIWKEADAFVKNVLVFKGTSEEISFLPKNALEEAKSKILIETKSKKGVTAWEKGEKIELRPEKIIKTENTIGAGDTFMSAFVYKFIDSGDVKDSLLFALDYTTCFLVSWQGYS